jgi:hypothetical protein
MLPSPNEVREFTKKYKKGDSLGENGTAPLLFKIRTEWDSPEKRGLAPFFSQKR